MMTSWAPQIPTALVFNVPTPRFLEVTMDDVPKLAFAMTTVTNTSICLGSFAHPFLGLMQKLSMDGHKTILIPISGHDYLKLANDIAAVHRVPMTPFTCITIYTQGGVCAVVAHH